MTHAHDRSGALLCALGIALAGCGGDPPPEARAVGDEPLLVVQDRGPLVVSGRDTTMVLAPTVFAWFDVSTPATAQATDPEALTRFRRSLSDAEPGLRAMGVRVLRQSVRPAVAALADGSPATDPAGAGAAPFGYLLVDIAGHTARRDDVIDGAALVCLAALTFGLAAPGC